MSLTRVIRPEATGRALPDPCGGVPQGHLAGGPATYRVATRRAVAGTRTLS